MSLASLPDIAVEAYPMALPARSCRRKLSGLNIANLSALEIAGRNDITAGPADALLVAASPRLVGAVTRGSPFNRSSRFDPDLSMDLVWLTGDVGRQKHADGANRRGQDQPVSEALLPILHGPSPVVIPDVDSPSELETEALAVIAGLEKTA